MDTNRTDERHPESAFRLRHPLESVKLASLEGLAPTDTESIRRRAVEAARWIEGCTDEVAMSGVAFLPFSVRQLLEHDLPALIADVTRLRTGLVHHLDARDDPCQDRGVDWPCDVARLLVGTP